ncbi:hypothetical protein BsWGS_02879 [Bradybaena similaris]
MTSIISTTLRDALHYYNTSGHNFSYNVSATGYSRRSNDSSDSISVTKNVMVPSVMFFLGVLGNVTALIILTIRPSKDSKCTAFYQLVKALACMDLFGIVASSPVTIIVYLKHGFLIDTGGMKLCHYFSFILVLAGNATVFIVLVMAAERYIVTKYPFKYTVVVKPLTVNCSIAVVWGLSTLIALLPIFGMGRNVQPWPGTWCFFDYRSRTLDGQIYSYSYAIAGLLAILVTIILNLSVIRHLWRMRRSRLSTSSIRSDQFSPRRESRANRGQDSEKRMVIFLMAITIVFTVCYAPLMVRIIMNQMGNLDVDLEKVGLDNTIDLWALRLACFNQILDPWVYIISRVTCCKASTGRDNDVLSHSTRSYNAVSAVFNNHKHSHHQHDLGNKENPLLTTVRSVRHLFSREKCNNCEKETVTIPLQAALTHKVMTSTCKNGCSQVKE